MTSDDDGADGLPPPGEGMVPPGPSVSRARGQPRAPLDEAAFGDSLRAYWHGMRPAPPDSTSPPGHRPRSPGTVAEETVTIVAVQVTVGLRTIACMIRQADGVLRPISFVAPAPGGSVGDNLDYFLAFLSAFLTLSEATAFVVCGLLGRLEPGALEARLEGRKGVEVVSVGAGGAVQRRWRRGWTLRDLNREVAAQLARRSQ